MNETFDCTVTHRQMIAGQCPWCKCLVRNYAIATPGYHGHIREPFIDWEVVAKDLESADINVRSVTVTNLSSARPQLESILPLLSLALIDHSQKIRSEAEAACQQIARRLALAQVTYLEEQSSNSSVELAVRIMLLNYYFTLVTSDGRRQRTRHTLWLIEHCPYSDTAGSPAALLVPDEDIVAFRKARHLWQKNCDAFSTDTIILRNAALFFMYGDPAAAESFLLQNQRLEPHNPEWHNLLGQLYLQAASGGGHRNGLTNSRRALREFEAAEHLSASRTAINEEASVRLARILDELHLLTERAKAAVRAGDWKRAKEYAGRLLAASDCKDIPESIADAISPRHYANIVLGRIAMNDNDLKRASYHLIESSRTNFSPVLKTFGPNMSLALDLLERNETDVVVKYLEMCKTVWINDGGRINEWIEAILHGVTPDFGANLNY